MNRLILLISLLLFQLGSEASHIIGAELTYETYPGLPINPRRYLVSAKLYRDNSGSTAVDFGPTIPLFCRLNACSPTDPSNITVQLTRVSRTNTGYLRCSGGPAVEVQVYEGEVTLRGPGNWTLSLAEENRTFGILNLSNSSTYSLYIDAELTVDPALGPNASPVFTSPMLPYICSNQFHRFSFSTFDANGDSLVYSMISPRGILPSEFCPQAIPVTPSPHFVIDPARGELSTVPFSLMVGNYIMAARVEEYRWVGGSWRKLGSVMRDIMYPVSAGTGNRNPTFATTLSVGAATQPISQELRVAPGQTIVAKLTAADQDAGQVLRFSSGVTAIPGVSFQSLSATQAQLTWQVPANLPAGRYSIPVVVQDNGCPINGSESQTLNFVVTAQALSSTPRHEFPNLAAFPIPFQERVQFQLATRTTQAVLITDEMGRLVTQLTSRPDGLVIWQPGATVPAGLYFARSADGSQVARLLHAAP